MIKKEVVFASQLNQKRLIKTVVRSQVKELIKAAGSIHQLAKFTGFRRQTISHWLRGNTLPSDNSLKTIGKLHTLLKLGRLKIGREVSP